MAPTFPALLVRVCRTLVLACPVSSGSRVKARQASHVNQVSQVSQVSQDARPRYRVADARQAPAAQAAGPPAAVFLVDPVHPVLQVGWVEEAGAVCPVAPARQEPQGPEPPVRALPVARRPAIACPAFPADPEVRACLEAPEVPEDRAALEAPVVLDGVGPAALAGLADPAVRAGSAAFPVSAAAAVAAGVGVTTVATAKSSAGSATSLPGRSWRASQVSASSPSWC